ncbi:MAG: NUMOD3 domain-containing DNA-binding protein [Gammaproteobacteria bacterium]|nr:NUMOD3 domain-containing DNA-binding protein [Gammaproteobacteria bacterium]
MLPAQFIKNKYYLIYYKIIDRAKSRNISGYIERHHVIPKSLGGSNDKSNMVCLTAKEHFICHRLLTKFTTGKFKLSMDRAAWRVSHIQIKNKEVLITSSQYEKLKTNAAKAQSILMTGTPKSPEHIENMKKAFKGRPSSFKGKHHTEENKLRHSKILKEKYASGELFKSQETIEKHRASRQGYKHSEETKRKISESQIGKTVIVKEETKEKISKTLKARYKDQVHHLKGRPAHNRGKSRTDAEKAKMSAGHQNREHIVCEHCNKSVPKPNYSRWHGSNCRAILN